MSVPLPRAPTSPGAPHRPRPPYSHHAGYYRSLDPNTDLSRPWEHTPRSEGDPPMSPMIPVFAPLASRRRKHHRPYPSPRDALDFSGWWHRHDQEAYRDLPTPVSPAPSPLHSSTHSQPSSLRSSDRSLLGKPNEFGFVVGTIPVPSSQLRMEKREKKGLWAKIKRFFGRRGALAQDTSFTVPVPPPQISEPKPKNPYDDPVPWHEWKQYGYWARPYIDNIRCDNSPVTSEKSITTEALDEVIRNMRDPPEQGGEGHAERWIVGVKHRALPSRPARWAKDPDPNVPLPFPWEVQVNPLLQHLLWGPPPLSWCVTEDPRNKNLFYGRTPTRIECEEGDRAQPATYPFLTAMHFCAVLGDHAYKFPWSFTVHNPRGIKVKDVLVDIWRCFHEPVLEDERSSWDMIRQDAASKTLEARCMMNMTYGRGPSRDVMRRSDALGGIMWFRGIEASVDGRGWMIAFGAY